MTTDAPPSVNVSSAPLSLRNLTALSSPTTRVPLLPADSQPSKPFSRRNAANSADILCCCLVVLLSCSLVVLFSTWRRKNEKKEKVSRLPFCSFFFCPSSTKRNAPQPCRPCRPEKKAGKRERMKKLETIIAYLAIVACLCLAPAVLATNSTESQPNFFSLFFPPSLPFPHSVPATRSTRGIP